jgi:hypothetical protein
MAVNFSRCSTVCVQGVTLKIVVCLDLVHHIVLNKAHNVLGSGPFPFTGVWDQFCFVLATLLCLLFNKTQCTKYRR